MFWCPQGLCHAENDEDKKAIICLEKAVEQDPYNLDVRLVMLCMTILGYCSLFRCHVLFLVHKLCGMRACAGAGCARCLLCQRIKSNACTRNSASMCTACSERHNKVVLL